MGDFILQLKGVCKNFSTVEVLKDVSFTLNRKNILGLIGENGAGKSTLMNILGGVYQRSGGEMTLNGQAYNPRNPDDAKKAGIAFIHQELNLFTNLSIAENIFIDESHKKTAGFISFAKLNNEAKNILAKLNIHINPRTLISDLPMGIRQMVEIAKAIAKNARIIIFDEPTTSLSNTEKEVLFSIMKDLSSQGISMIFISHALDDVLNLCDEVLVLRDGRVIGSQEKTGDLTKELIIKNMVGREMTKLYPYVEKKPGKELFTVKNVSKAGVVENISFDLFAGRIIGMFGLMGAGRSEFANIVFGVDQPDSGEITLNGKLMKHWTPGDWINSGVAYITENRRDDGLLLPKSVKDNLILVNMYRMKSGFGVLNQKAAAEISHQMVDKLQIKTFDSAKQTVRSLSGGNQQKVVIGKWLMIAPKVFILDEPTRGVDVGAKYEIYNHINSLAEDGSAVLFISSEMDELMGVCDSILVMSRGRITGEVRRNDFSQERLMKLALGE